jgi:hypothetical protein
MQYDEHSDTSVQTFPGSITFNKQNNLHLSSKFPPKTTTTTIIIIIIIIIQSQDSSASIAMGYGLNGHSSIPNRVKRFFHAAQT